MTLQFLESEMRGTEVSYPATSHVTQQKSMRSHREDLVFFIVVQKDMYFGPHMYRQPPIMSEILGMGLKENEM